MKEINRYAGSCVKTADIIVHLRYTVNNEIINTYFGIDWWQYSHKVNDILINRPPFTMKRAKILAIRSFINRCGHNNIVAVYRIKRKQIKLT